LEYFRNKVIANLSDIRAIAIYKLLPQIFVE
jgi:hypothetical protein